MSDAAQGHIARMRKSSPSLNLCITTGPWQLLLVSAAVKTWSTSSSGDRNVLILSVKPSEMALLQPMQQMAAELEIWDEVLVLEQSDVPKDAAFAGRQLCRNFHRMNVQSIWVATLQPVAHRIFALLFPKAPVYIYEDGLASVTGGYPSRPFLKRLSWMRAALNTAYSCSRLPGLQDGYNASPHHCNQLALRIKCAYFTDPILYAVGHYPYDIRTICTDTIVHMANLISLPEQATEIPQKSHWFIDGNHRWHKTLTAEDELAIILPAIKSLLNRGQSVVWKMHPRAKDGFLDRIREEAKGIYIIPEEIRRLPLELLYKKASPKSIFSIESTSLFNARLFGIPSYTLISTDEMRKGGDFYERTQVVTCQRLIPPFESLLKSIDSKAYSSPTTVE